MNNLDNHTENKTIELQKKNIDVTEGTKMDKSVTQQNIISPWMNTQQASAYLGVAVKTLYNWRSTGLVKAHNMHSKRGAALRFRKEDLDEVLNPKRRGR